MAVLISKNGFVKRMPVDTFKSRNRGGRGIAGMSTRDEDSIEHLLITNTHTCCYVLLIKVVFLRLNLIMPETTSVKGVSLAHFLNFDEDEVLNSIIDVQSFNTNDYLFMTTKKVLLRNRVKCLYSF